MQHNTVEQSSAKRDGKKNKCQKNEKLFSFVCSIHNRTKVNLLQFVVWQNHTLIFLFVALLLLLFGVLFIIIFCYVCCCCWRVFYVCIHKCFVSYLFFFFCLTLSPLCLLLNVRLTKEIEKLWHTFRVKRIMNMWYENDLMTTINLWFKGVCVFDFFIIQCKN